MTLLCLFVVRSRFELRVHRIGIDTSQSYGQFIAELLVAQARMESANTSARQMRKAQEQREQGLPPSNGRRCFGYNRGYTAGE